MGMQRLPGLELVAGAALILAFGAGSVRCAGAGNKVPMPRKGAQPFVEAHFARDRVMKVHNRSGVVEQDFSCDPTKMMEGGLQAIEPRRLTFMIEGHHVRSA